MSSFDLAQVRHVAMLSRLAFSDDEARLFAGHLSAILDYVEKLDALNVEGVEPTSHALELTNVLRRDEPHPSLPPGEALANAPESEAQCFRVPPIIQAM
jgi:aspartyl-tRNA(Asn)/glutamyl-tRNA(Gln) amidotransferase subunit C